MASPTPPSRKSRAEHSQTKPSPRAGASRPALWRVVEISKIIQAGQYPNCTSLAREIEVTPKTIQRDISFMRDQLGQPLEYHPVKRGYYYTEDVKEFPMLKLSRHDLVALFLARHALEPLRGTRLERMLAASFSKIAEACPGEVSIEWHELDHAFSVKTAGVLATDITLFGDLLDAIRSSREVSFDYHKLAAESVERRNVRPHHLGQIEHGWYLIAYDCDRQAMRTFALQRMSRLTLSQTHFRRETGFNVRDHLGGSFGVWSYAGEQPQNYQVQLQFEGYAARVVAERQWHPSQTIRRLQPDGSRIEFQATLSGLEEITRWILSWGSKVKVLGPAALQKRIADEVQQMMS